MSNILLPVEDLLYNVHFTHSFYFVRKKTIYPLPSEAYGSYASPHREGGMFKSDNNFARFSRDNFDDGSFPFSKAENTKTGNPCSLEIVFKTVHHLDRKRETLGRLALKK